MTFVVQLMLAFLIVCAVAVCVTRNLLASVVIYMGYSLIMSVIWITLESPDLAITEAAVGAGVTSLLLFLTLKKIHAIDAAGDARERGKTAEIGAKAAGEPLGGAVNDAPVNNAPSDGEPDDGVPVGDAESDAPSDGEPGDGGEAHA